MPIASINYPLKDEIHAYHAFYVFRSDEYFLVAVLSSLCLFGGGSLVWSLFGFGQCGRGEHPSFFDVSSLETSLITHP